jgi:hypothetical protein
VRAAHACPRAAGLDDQRLEGVRSPHGAGW